jgi:hypothetical protein
MDAIVALALGAMSRLRALDAWLDVAVRAERGERLASDDPTLLAVLGLISLRRTTLRWIDEAAAAPTTAGAEARRKPAPSTGLLR